MIFFGLNNAKLLFTSGFMNHEGLVNLMDAGHVEPSYEKDLPEKYNDRDFPENDKDNDYTILVKKQNAEAKKFPSKSPIAIILRKEILSPFNFVDDYYYYIVQRKSFSKYWNKDLGIPKFERTKEGIQIPFTILKHIDRNNAEKTSELVVVLEDMSIYFCPSRTLLEFFRDQHMPLFINSYGTMMTGFPKELFKEKWK